MECTKYKLLQYVGKAKTGLIIRLSGHHKDVLKLNAIPANQHLTILKHKAKERNGNASRKYSKSARIIKLETLCPKGLELN